MDFYSIFVSNKLYIKYFIMENSTNNWETSVKKNTLQLGLWTGAWVITLAIATFGPIFLWNGNDSLTIIALVVNLLIGIGMILINIRHLKSLDELQRKIHLEAMGIALGVAVVFGISYSSLDTTNLISYDAEISHLVVIIGLTYLAGVIIGTKRYR